MNQIANPALLLSASLYFTEGSSNKEYHAEVVKKDGGFIVNFRYGRRGTSLTSGTKTGSPVSLEQAKKVFEKLVQEKMGKGYTSGETGVAFQSTPNEGRVSGLLPQLLNAVTEDEATLLISNTAYMMQPKMDGRRIMVRRTSGEIVANNRKGLVVAIPKPVEEGLLGIGDGTIDFVLDGELIGNVYHVFDCIAKDGGDLCGFSAQARYETASLLVDDGIASVCVVPSVTRTDSKTLMFAKVKAEKGEGVVFKLTSSPYTVGRPNSGGAQLKYKFTESASCIVQSVHATKRSVGLVLLEDGAEVFVGNVTIPPNYNIPVAGDVVELEYLYAFKGGSLFQPVYRSTRDDIDREACVTAQLKYKPEGEGE